MGKVVYFVSGGAGQNVNSQWFNNFIQGNSRGIKYVGYGVVAAVSIYILLPSVNNLITGRDMFSSQSKRSDRTTTGLFNNRNDCFANSSVQALSALPRLTRYLNDVLEQASQMAHELEQRYESTRENHKVLQQTPGAPSAPSGMNKSPGELRQLQQQHREHFYHLNPPQSSSGLATPKLELEQNPLDMHFDNGSRPGLAALKSTTTVNTVTTLKDDDNDDGDAEISENLNGNDGSAVNPPKLPLHRSLASMLEQLQRTTPSSRAISVWPLLHSLEVIFNARISSGQNDAHELTQVILERLQNEINELRHFSKDENLSIDIPEIPFRGNLADHLVCTACHNSSKVRITQFNMLSLTVPQAISAKLAEMVSENQLESIEGYSCLTCKVGKILENEKSRDTSKYEASEQNILASLVRAFPNMTINDDVSQDLITYIDNYNKDGLVTSQLKSTIVKKNIIVRAPQVLVIHLSRSMFNGSSYSRNPCAVTFDEVLGLQEQVIENNKCVCINSVTYELKAIIKHTGSHSQGHYQCYKHKPDFVKDIDTHAVINRSPVIDATLINIHDPQDSKEVAATEMMEPPPLSFNGSSKPSNGSRGPSNPNDNNDSEDYDFDNEETMKIRMPARFKKITNFLSGKSSPSSSNSNLGSPDPSDSDNGGSRGRRRTVSRHGGSRPASIVRTSVSRSRASSLVSQAISQPTRSRSRANSSSSMRSYRSRADSMSSDKSSSDLSEGTSPDSNAYWTTSASDTDNNNNNAGIHKRHLKKIKSVLKYPYWAISDTIIHEAKPEEVLNETKYVYMLYYERIST